MTSDFLKQLIALLASVGGSASLPLADLTTLGIEFTIDSLGSSDATLRLRLGAKIYYVPDKAAAGKEQPWPTTPPETTIAESAAAKAQSRLDQEIDAINQLNNRPRRLRPAPAPPEEALPSPSSDETSYESLPPTSSLLPSRARLTEAERQGMLTAPPPSQRRIVPKTDMDLFLREQEIKKQKELSATRKARDENRRGRQYPWETRNAPPIKLQ